MRKKYILVKRLTDQEKIDVVNLYLTNQYTCKFLGKKFGISGVSIANLLRRRNIKINNDQTQIQKIYSINENFFDIINTEEKAYFLGFLYADGCNMENNNSIVLGLQESDREILEKLSIIIGSNRPLAIGKINSKKYPNRKNRCDLCISNKHISKKLAELGCFSKKSLILKFPTLEQVPDFLLNHFIRGYFDGDGSIYQCSKKTLESQNRQKESYRCCIVSSVYFCEKLKNVIENKLNIKCFIKDKNKNKNPIVKELRIYGNTQIFKFIDWIYKDCKIALKRKHLKYKEIEEYLIKNPCILNGYY